MTNLAFILAAYSITLGALAGYGMLVWSRLRLAEHQIAMMAPPQEGGYGQR